MGTVVDKLNKILSTKAAIKQAIISKGVSVSDTDTFASYADKIESITTGGGSATKYGATIDTFLGDIDENGVLQQPIDGNLVFTGVVSVPSDLLQYKFYKNSNIKSVEFPDLTSIDSNGLSSCFQNCTSLTTTSTFANLTSIGSNGLSACFWECTSLTTAPTFANLTSISSNGLRSCFYGCTSLIAAPTFTNLTSIGNYGLYCCFDGCTSLTTAPTFTNLTSIGDRGLYNCFYGCTSLTTAPTFASLTSIDEYGLYQCFENTKITSISFPALKSTSFGSRTNQFNNMLSIVTGCTVHFPSNLESVIGSWSDVTSGFGGTNTTVLFDLPATE